MTELSLEEVKDRQLEILSRIDSFCADNGIRYSLAFGSLLGAVRHHGYIPWDDDIDIMMLREDYERFLSSYKDTETQILSARMNSLYILPFAKVVDRNSILVEQSSMKVTLGVYVDVFPVDNIPDDPSLCDSFYRKKLLLNYLLNIKVLSYGNNRSLWKNTLLAIGKTITCCIPAYKLTKRIEVLAQKYNRQKCEKAAVFVPTDNKKRWIVNRSIFEHFVKIPFEDKMFYAVEDSDTYLRATYGNYMELPPEEKRVSNHGFKAWRK